MPDHMNPLALMAAISKSQRNGETVNRTSREMPVNTELIRKVFLKDSSSSELSQNRKLEEIQKKTKSTDPNSAFAIAMSAKHKTLTKR